MQISVNIFQSSGCFSGVGGVQCRAVCSQSTVSLFLSLLAEEVEHDRLQVVSKGTDSRHQPVRTEVWVSAHHALCYIHLQGDRGIKISKFHTSGNLCG